MARPDVALLTDFGTRDHYAGTLKGVVLSVCPDATLVDIGHDIPAHDVLAGALELAACYRYFPHGTIFLVVVDPGVGSSRRGIAADIGDYRVRRARQRRAVGGVSRIAAEEGRRADRAQVRAADRQPHVRGPRSVCAGGGLPGQGRRAGVARQEHLRTITSIDLPRPVVDGARNDAARWCASIGSAT